MRVMLTGHRYVDPKAYDTMVSLLVVLKGHCSDINESLTVISGGNLGSKTQPTGADRYWALAAHNLGIPYEIWVPHGYGYNYYSGNQDMWNRWGHMILRASAVKVIGDTSKVFDWKNNFVRNQAMIDTADRHVVCSDYLIHMLLKQTKGGTADAVKKMAKAKVQHLYHIKPSYKDWIYSYNYF